MKLESEETYPAKIKQLHEELRFAYEKKKD